jgi:hypothetical protein
LISEIDPASWEGRVLVRGRKEGEGDGEGKWRLVERVRTKTRWRGLKWGEWPWEEEDRLWIYERRWEGAGAGR